MNYSLRLEKLRSYMVDRELDLIMILAGPNMYYLSGYTAISLERLISLIVFSDTMDMFLIIPELERDRAEDMVRLDSLNMMVYSDVENPVKMLVDLIRGRRVRRIGVEGFIPYRYIAGLMKYIGRVGFDVVDDVFYRLRIVKDEDEIEFLRKAAEINMQVMVEAIANISEGMTEKMLMSRIRSLSIELGADDVPFTLVQSGPNSAMPHQEPTDRTIVNGDIVLLDLGLCYKGYISDITRTVVVGDYSEKQEMIFNIVREAQNKALSIIKPGVPAESVDNAARNVISDYGYGKFFIHRTGHGLGLEVHEEPYIKSGNKLSLKPGMVFTVEPGIYLPGEFGVRLEDNVVVSEEGVVNLTELPKSLNIEDYL
jgi:Xaa-Pro aminopeptidase